MNVYNPSPNLPQPLVSLVEILQTLLAQANIYETVLPVNNYPARAAVAVLADMARSALNEARSLSDLLDQPPSGPHPFTHREYEVLQLAARGLSNKEIAYRLGISDRTIQYHINAIFNKTGASSRTEAVALALANHWLAHPTA